MGEMWPRPLLLPLAALPVLLGCAGREHSPALASLLEDRARHRLHVEAGVGHSGQEVPVGFLAGRLLPGGGMVLLDRRAPQLWWVDPEGNARTDVVPTGAGPREIRGAVHLAANLDSTVAVLTGHSLLRFSPSGQLLGNAVTLAQIGLGITRGCQPREWVVYGPTTSGGSHWLRRYRLESDSVITVASGLPVQRRLGGLGLGKPVGLITDGEGTTHLQWDIDKERGAVEFTCEGTPTLQTGAATEWIAARPTEVPKWKRGAALLIGAGSRVPGGMVLTGRGMLFAEVSISVGDSLETETTFTLIDSAIVASATVPGLYLLVDAANGEILLLPQLPTAAAITVRTEEFLNLLSP